MFIQLRMISYYGDFVGFLINIAGKNNKSVIKAKVSTIAHKIPK